MQGSPGTFVKKTLYFLSWVLLLALMLFLLLRHFNVRLLEKQKLSDNIHTVFIGDSHVQLTVNDELIANSCNYSQRAEAYIYSFYKLKRLLNESPSLNKVVLGFGYHNLSAVYDEYIWGVYGAEVSARYFFVLPNSERLRIMSYHTSALAKYVKNVLIINGKNVFPGQSEYCSSLGAYSNGFVNQTPKQDVMDDRIKFLFYKEGKQHAFSSQNIAYLDSIIDLCKQRKIELRMLNTPLHGYYKQQVPKEYVERYVEFLSSRQLKLIDLENLPLSDSCFIADGDHVSEAGARVVSEILDKTINGK